MTEVPSNHSIIDFWQNLEPLKIMTAEAGGNLTMVVHPTWQTPDVQYTERYYQELGPALGNSKPKVLFYEPDTELEIAQVLEGMEMYGIETVNDADAMPRRGWRELFSALKTVGPSSISLVGQNINFWTDVPLSQVPQDVLDFNLKHREQLDTLGAGGRIVYPVQCLGSLWLELDKNLPEVNVKLTKAVHPLIFINFQDRGLSKEANFNAI